MSFITHQSACLNSGTKFIANNLFILHISWLLCSIHKQIVSAALFVLHCAQISYLRDLLMSILEIRDLSLAFNGNNILNHIDLDIWEGHVHAIVGPNGAGKSTLAYTIMGLNGYRDFEGDIFFDGERINDLSIYQRSQMGITLGWQEPARFEGIPIRTFLSVSAKNNSRKNVRDALEKVALDPDSYMNRAVDKTLSGGERKKNRAGLAHAHAAETSAARRTRFRYRRRGAAADIRHYKIRSGYGFNGYYDNAQHGRSSEGRTCIPDVQRAVH